MSMEPPPIMRQLAFNKSDFINDEIIYRSIPIPEKLNSESKINKKTFNN